MVQRSIDVVSYIVSHGNASVECVASFVRFAGGGEVVSVKEESLCEQGASGCQ